MLFRHVRHHQAHLYAGEICQASQIALVWLQVTDMRTQKEIATYRGHNRDVTCAAWHPLHEELFASGGYDGSLMYWLVSNPEPQVMLPFTALYCPSLPFTALHCLWAQLLAAFRSAGQLPCVVALGTFYIGSMRPAADGYRVLSGC